MCSSSPSRASSSRSPLVLAIAYLSSESAGFHSRGNIRFVNTEARFRRAIERRALWMAEDAARELPNLPLEDALQLVHLYAERGSPKYEKAALRWRERYLGEGTPRLRGAECRTVRRKPSDGARRREPIATFVTKARYVHQAGRGVCVRSGVQPCPPPGGMPLFSRRPVRSDPLVESGEETRRMSAAGATCAPSATRQPAKSCSGWRRAGRGRRPRWQSRRVRPTRTVRRETARSGHVALG